LRIGILPLGFVPKDIPGKERTEEAKKSRR